jgi:DNA-binding CsgD family transcriptional regulator
MLRRVPSRRDPSVPALRATALEQSGERLVVFSWPVDASAAPASGLTGAERAVHALLLAGLSDADIAEVRCTTRSTVTKQVDAVFRKLGVRSRRELIARGPLRGAQRASGSIQRP